MVVNYECDGTFWRLPKAEILLDDSRRYQKWLPNQVDLLWFVSLSRLALKLSLMTRLSDTSETMPLFALIFQECDNDRLIDKFNQSVIEMHNLVTVTAVIIQITYIITSSYCSTV